MVSFCAGVSAFTAVLYWRYNVAIRHRLYDSETKVRAISSKRFQECQRIMKDLQKAWELDDQERRGQLRALQLQNIEQTRSVARLEGTMKTCVIR